jgi:putative nucleotidyltransferase with HDIG domain
MSEGITLKGEFQAAQRPFLQAVFGIEDRVSRRDGALIAYTVGLALAFAGLSASVALFAGFVPDGPIWPLAVLGLSALIAERQSVRLTPRGEASVAFLPIVLAVVIYGPAAAIYVGIASLILEFKEPYARWFLWTSSRSVAAGCAGLVALHVGGNGDLSFGRLTATVAAATVAQQGTDFLLGAVLARLRGSSFQEIGRIGSAALVTVPLYMPITALLVYTYRELSPWSVALFLFPAFAAQKLFLLYREQRATAEELARAVLRQEQAHLSFASALVATIDARDRYTAGHSASVAAYARDIANRLGLTEDRQRLAHLCGLVHDVGKIGLPTGLLEKAGPLTLEERRQMEEHSAIGERILAKVDDYAEIARIVRHHHERVDGGGYPDGLAKDDIPLISRILAVADAYDAMTSDRPYRDAMPAQVARMRMAQAVGTQFDTSVVAAFEAILAQASEDYRVGVGPEFAFASLPERTAIKHPHRDPIGPLPRLHAQAS